MKKHPLNRSTDTLPLLWMCAH